MDCSPLAPIDRAASEMKFDGYWAEQCSFRASGMAFLNQ
jgi:hypothetical protein